MPNRPWRISIGNNVNIATNVSFFEHDIIHRMWNGNPKYKGPEILSYGGYITVEDNVMIGANAIILYDLVIGHDALVAAGALKFEDGLKLVYARAMAMQKACEAVPGTMAAVIGLPDETIEDICKEVSSDGNIVVPANYNCPGQLVISGNVDAINIACEKLKAAGAKRALPLKVGGAFHSPLMQPAKEELEKAIEATTFSAPKCPVYQNFDGKAHTRPEEIKANLIAQLTGSVRWTECVQNMISDGADDFTECGPGKALQGMIGRIDRNVSAHGII